MLICMFIYIQRNSMVVKTKKQFFMTSLTVLFLVISGLRYHKYGDVPLLSFLLTSLDKMGEHQLLQKSNHLSTCECECNSKPWNKAEYEGEPKKVIPYIAPGPSKVQELVPLKVLKKSISFERT